MDASASTSAPHKPGIAERLWEAARAEFSQRGYHGARVQGIARRAGCNVALLYRHWASKRALYVDILRSVWQAQAQAVTTLLERGTGLQAVVEAYLDALMKDHVGSQIMVREYLEGGPFLSQVLEAEPSLAEPVRQAVAKLSSPNGGPPLRPGLDPTLVVLTVGGVASLVASAHEVVRLFVAEAVPPEKWREHLHDLFMNGLAAR